VQQVDEAVALLVSQDKNPAFHKVVSGLKAVHPPRNVGGLRIQPINLLKPKQEAAPVQQVAIYLTGTKKLFRLSQKDLNWLNWYFDEQRSTL